MEILLTGSTAAHVSQTKNEKTRTFHGDLYKALTSSKNKVTWMEPSVSMSKDFIAEFDSVIVGLAPPTSTAAHKIYGSLSVIDHAWDLENLVLVVDAPEPRRVWAGIKSIHSNPESLVKDFYSKRSEYKKTLRPDVFDRIQNSIKTLVDQVWPTTLFPALPWMSFASVSTHIPNTSKKNLVGLNFDSNFIKDNNGFITDKAPEFWVSDTPNSVWTKKQEELIQLPTTALKRSRWEGDADSLLRLQDAVGCFVSTHRGGEPWWSSAVAQSLSSRVPVVTDWTLSSILGESWRFLPASIEEMSQRQRRELVEIQKESYKSSLLNWEDSVQLLNRVIKD